jgi:hypothetical protein
MGRKAEAHQAEDPGGSCEILATTSDRRNYCVTPGALELRG